MTCADLEPLLAARMAGDITADDLAVLGAHLRDCRDCAYLAGRLELPAVADALASAAEDERDFPELTVVDEDNYVRGQEIGRGGMGRILRARDRRLGRAVAIKELIDERLRPRFEREARLTARLQHPAIVSVHEAGRWPSGEPFYAMKYVAGRRLDAVVADAKSLRERLDLLPNFLIVVEAVAYAHAEGVIHRDVKPQNILIGPFGETVVIDWGLAKDLGADAEELGPYRELDTHFTVAGVGTPAYMAPEQARGETPDVRVDVYSLGATLAHLLAGHAPDGKPLPHDVPAELCAIVAKATAERPDARYRSASELAGELRRYQSGQLVGAHRYGLGELALRFLRRHRPVVALSALFLVALGSVGVVSVQRVVTSAKEARHQRDEADRALTASLAERGRIELVGGEPSRAMPYLVGALERGLDTPELRLMLGLAEKATSGLVMSVDDVQGAAALDPAGKRLAVSGPGNAVRIVDVPSGTVLATLRKHRAPVGFLAWSPDGNQLATASPSTADRTVCVWNAGDGRLVASTTSEDSFSSLRAGPAGTFVGTAGDSALVWNGQTFVRMVSPARLTDASFDPSGRRLVTAGSDGVARIWEVASKNLIVSLEKHDSGLQGATFSPDGTRVVTAGWDHQAGVWDAATGKRLASLDMKSGSVYEAAFSPDGVRVLVRTFDTATIFWTDGDKVADLEGGFGPSSIAWAGSDEVIVTGRDGVVRLYNDYGTPVGRHDGHVGPAWGLGVARGDTLIASAGSDGTAKVWRAKPDGVNIGGGIGGARFDDRGHVLVSEWTDGASLRDVDTGALVAALNEPTGPLRPYLSCRLGDGRLVVVAGQKLLWDPLTDERWSRPDNAECVDDEGNHSWRDMGPEPYALRDLVTGARLSANLPWLREATLSPDRRTFAGLADDGRRVQIVEVATGALLGSFEAPQQVQGLRFTAAGLVVFGKFGDPELHELATGRLIGTFAGHHGAVSRAEASADGRYLVTSADDRTARLYLVATRDLVWSQRLGSGTGIAIDADARHLLLENRILSIAPDERSVAEIATTLSLVPYALEDGHLVAKRPPASVSRVLPAAPIPAAARPTCPSGSIPRGALPPFGLGIGCAGRKRPVGAMTTFWANGAVEEVLTVPPDDLRWTGDRWNGLPRHQLLMDRQGRVRFEVGDTEFRPIFREYGPLGRLVREERRDGWLGASEVRTWHPNGALAERAISTCVGTKECLRATIQWATFYDDGHKASAGAKELHITEGYIPVGVWSFFSRTGEETKFDFGKCRRCP